MPGRIGHNRSLRAGAKRRRTQIGRENLSFNGESRMGKGDKRSFRGKLFKGSHGKTRPGRPAKKAADAQSKRSK